MSKLKKASTSKTPLKILDDEGSINVPHDFGTTNFNIGFEKLNLSYDKNGLDEILDEGTKAKSPIITDVKPLTQLDRRVRATECYSSSK